MNMFAYKVIKNFATHLWLLFSPQNNKNKIKVEGQKKSVENLIRKEIYFGVK